MTTIRRLIVNTLSKVSMAAVALSFVAGFSVSASADSETTVTASNVAEATQVPVSFEDLDLDSAQGQETLYYRISRAAEQACGSSDIRQAGSLSQATRNRDCYRDSMSRALSEVSSGIAAVVTN